MPKGSIENSSHSLKVKSSIAGSQYLGSPILVNNRLRTSHKELIDRVSSKINAWSTKLLSQAGRTALIKSVLQSIPTYTMSTTILPSTMTSKLDKSSRTFWWFNSKDPTHHTMAWRKQCCPKTQGGLGFRTSAEMNKAMFGKQIWRLLTEKHGLWNKLIKEKYFPNTSLFAAKKGQRSSCWWKHAHRVSNTMKSNLLWVVKDGSNISVVVDPWIPSIPGHIPNLFTSGNTSPHANIKVAELLNPDHSWNHTKLQELFDEDFIAHIQNITLQPN
ncbi:PREDICTED: uncharacterized protein LOC109114971 [Nelumbo nucifera]|uniref:Uncharacterized protein LOC109114971 n=1 Tax=Nelumbo nucifera TaxID=4432 RepID=A0A1U8Q7N4_NELNU|nr:PREDICTED: uncharacterized protein LOC109114971 [Nelumbo nucifera]